MQARAGSPFCGLLDALGPPCLTANVSFDCMPSRSRIQLLPDRQFWATYRRCCPAIKNSKDPKVRREVYDELNRLDAILRPALKARWGKTDAYWEVMDDWNVCYHHSMGVYSDQMCRAEFLDIVQRALAQMKHHWCFHVSLECNEDLGWGLQQAGLGQIFFYRRKIYGKRKDKFKYELFEN